MSPDNPLTWIPAGIALVFVIIGLASSRRTVLGILVAGYAALVVASQHNAFLTSVAKVYLSSNFSSSRQQGALVFVVTFAALFLVIYVLYRIVWMPVPQGSQIRPRQPEGSWSKLLMGLLNAVFGWMLGAVLLVVILTIQPLRTSMAPSREMQAYTTAIYDTVDISLGLVEPWLDSGLPLAFAGG